jgi:hypothetical protein
MEMKIFLLPCCLFPVKEAHAFPTLKLATIIQAMIMLKQREDPFEQWQPGE